MNLCDTIEPSSYDSLFGIFCVPVLHSLLQNITNFNCNPIVQIGQFCEELEKVLLDFTNHTLVSENNNTSKDPPCYNNTVSDFFLFVLLIVAVIHIILAVHCHFIAKKRVYYIISREKEEGERLVTNAQIRN